MRFMTTHLDGLLITESDRFVDERGGFVRHFCAGSFADAGVEFHPDQISQSMNTLTGTLRGLHFQHAPAAETKHVRCLAGAMWDVAVDIRPDSPTYLGWFGTELRPENARGLLIPKGFAHGFLTLADNTEILYATDYPWTKEAEGGLRWDDPAIGIEWPGEPVVLSDRDRGHRLLAER